MKLKVGDRVKIISGNEKGKLGYIKQIFHSQNKVIVKDLNFCDQLLTSLVSFLKKSRVLIFQI